MMGHMYLGVHTFSFPIIIIRCDYPCLMTLPESGWYNLINVYICIMTGQGSLSGFAHQKEGGTRQAT